MYCELSIVLITILVSVIAFYNKNVFDFLKLDKENFNFRKDYFRLLTAGFIHGNYIHLFLNVIMIFFYSSPLIHIFSIEIFIIIYLTSIILGNIIFLKILKFDTVIVGAGSPAAFIFFSFVTLYPFFRILYIIPYFLIAFLIISSCAYSIYKNNFEKYASIVAIIFSFLGMLTIFIFVKIEFISLITLFIYFPLLLLIFKK